MVEMGLPVVELARALVGMVPMGVVLVVLESAVVLQMAIPEIYMVVEGEEHGQGIMQAIELVALVLLGKS
jgi:hypothetical protein